MERKMVNEKIRRNAVQGIALIIIKAIMIAVAGLAVAGVIGFAFYAVWYYKTQYDVLTLIAVYSIFGTAIDVIIFLTTKDAILTMANKDADYLLARKKYLIKRYRRSQR